MAWLAIPGLRRLKLEDPEFEVLWLHSEKTRLKNQRPGFAWTGSPVSPRGFLVSTLQFWGDRCAL